MSDLKITSSRIGAEVTINLIGEMNEKANVTLPEMIEVTSVVFDFVHLKHLNSAGIRFWITLLGKLPSGSVVHFRNAPKFVVDQMSMVQGFMPSGSVVDSFEMPYFCDKCNKPDSEMLKAGVHFDQAVAGKPYALRLPKKTCGQVACEFEPDMMPKKYLKCLENPKKG
jgi:hypothetical protein